MNRPDLRVLPRIGPAVTVPLEPSDVPSLDAWILIGYSLQSQGWLVYNRGRQYPTFEAASAAAKDLPAVYVHVHAMHLQLGGGSVTVGGAA